MEYIVDNLVNLLGAFAGLIIASVPIFKLLSIKKEIKENSEKLKISSFDEKTDIILMRQVVAICKIFTIKYDKIERSQRSYAKRKLSIMSSRIDSILNDYAIKHGVKGNDFFYFSNFKNAIDSANAEVEAELEAIFERNGLSDYSEEKWRDYLCCTTGALVVDYMNSIKKKYPQMSVFINFDCEIDSIENHLNLIIVDILNQARLTAKTYSLEIKKNISEFEDDYKRLFGREFKLQI